MRWNLPFTALATGLATAAGAEGVTLLTLPANPSTGYHWVLREEASSGLDLVTIEDRGYGPPQSDLIGAPAPALLAVTCTGAGPVHLVFDYLSPDGSRLGETRAVDLACE